MSDLLRRMTNSAACAAGFVAGGILGAEVGKKVVQSINKISDIPDNCKCPYCEKSQPLPRSAFNWKCQGMFVYIIPCFLKYKYKLSHLYVCVCCYYECMIN